MSLPIYTYIYILLILVDTYVCEKQLRAGFFELHWTRDFEVSRLIAERRDRARETFEIFDTYLQYIEI